MDARNAKVTMSKSGFSYKLETGQLCVQPNSSMLEYLYEAQAQNSCNYFPNVSCYEAKALQLQDTFGMSVTSAEGTRRATF